MGREAYLSHQSNVEVHAPYSRTSYVLSLPVYSGNNNERELKTTAISVVQSAAYGLLTRKVGGFRNLVM
jgi:hypothetical protein